MKRPPLLLLALGWLASAGCRAPAPLPPGALPAPAPLAPADVEALRRDIGPCPLPLEDAALDDLATYRSCHLPSAVARLVRNDYVEEAFDPAELGALRRHAGAIPRTLFEAQLRRFVDPRGVLAGVIAIDAAGALRPDPVLAPGVVVPFAPPGGSGPGACDGPACAGRLVAGPHPERPFREARRRELLAMADDHRPLAGVRIAVDPGHAGGPYGWLEDRHVEAGGTGGPPVVLQEGDLALRTALELRGKLAARGAEVTLTRDRPALVHPQPLSSLRPAADALLRHLALDPGYVAIERSLEPADRLRLRSAVAVFAVKRRSRFESLRWRARVAPDADVFLSIHFNAAPPGRAAPQEVLAMVRGFHDLPRLYQPHHRWRALEGAFALDDFDASAHLGAGCVAAMASTLGLPRAGEPRYPDHLAIRAADGRPVGVDAWDGALLRERDGVAVLVEGPYVTDEAEAARLAAALEAPPGTPGTRTERYAEALATCVAGFARRWLDSTSNPFAADPPSPAVAAVPVDRPPSAPE